ncbi:MAG: hypothetical protein JWR02_1713, partial [Mucilaginibacter sp.]|nr:hypothetical protein [Mucilaginibacter sp.]
FKLHEAQMDQNKKGFPDTGKPFLSVKKYYL